MGTPKKLKKSRSRRAVSPVISSVILVVIAITVAVAISYWMGGIAGQYSNFEKVEIQNAVCKKVVSGTDYYWNITMNIKNTGTKDATLTNAYINDREVDTYGAAIFTVGDDNWQISMSQMEYLNSGKSTVVFVYIDPDKTDTSLSPGTAVNIKVHSASGMDFPKLIKLT